MARRATGAGGLPAIGLFAGHTRAFVKIQDGCDAFCAYCVVPYTRPRVWSRTIDDVLAECRRLVSGGHKEIVLSGVFLGAFGRDTAIRRRWGNHPALLPELLRQMGQIEGLWRVRLSSLEPLDADAALLGVCTGMGNFAPHFHLPLQSGSDRVLRRMNRQYTAAQFRQAVDRIRQHFDRPAFTTDIIVGFPGESDEDFAQTLSIARFSGFSKIHAFPFSAIEGTAAHLYKDEAPPPPVVRERTAALAGAESELAFAYRSRFVGQTVEGLVEMTAPGRRRQAITDRHLVVEFDGKATARTVVRIQIAGVTPDGLEGRLV